MERRAGLAWIGAALGVTAVGVLLALRCSGGEAPTAPAGAAELTGLRGEIASLREALVEERGARRALVDEIAALGLRLAALEQSQAPETRPAEGAGSAEQPDERELAREAAAGRSGASFDEEELLARGFDADEVERLRQSWEQHQLDLLFLRDRAAREGWLSSGRFRDEAGSLRRDFRGDLDAAEYDVMLWATGQDNRVVLEGVIGGSPAEQAGFLAGDVLLRYDDVDIYSPQALVKATRSGQFGESVAVEVLRNGRRLRLYLPRGPLGAVTQPTRLPPDPSR